MTKFFHSTWPHVILTEPEGQMFSCLSHGEVGGLRDTRWADQGHTVWRAQLYSLPRALSTWGWQTLVPGIDLDLSVLSSPWAMTQPPSLFCVAELTLDHILPLLSGGEQWRQGHQWQKAILTFWESVSLWRGWRRKTGENLFGEAQVQPWYLQNALENMPHSPTPLFLKVLILGL